MAVFGRSESLLNIRSASEGVSPAARANGQRGPAAHFEREEMYFASLGSRPAVEGRMYVIFDGQEHLIGA